MASEYMTKDQRDSRWSDPSNTRTALVLLEERGHTGLTDGECRDELGESVARSFRALRSKERRKKGEVLMVMKMRTEPGRVGEVHYLPSTEFPEW